MASPLTGLAAVAWSAAWQGAAAEAGLRLSVDASRLLGLLRGLPVAQALLDDLQLAQSAGKPVQVVIAPDRQSAQVITSFGRFVLTGAARDSVLGGLLGRPPGAPAAVEAAPAQAERSSKAPDAPGVLWQAPKAPAAQGVPAQILALPWLGASASLQVRRDGAGRPPSQSDGTDVQRAALRLQLPHLGHFEAQIRLCGNTVAISIDSACAPVVQGELNKLEQRLASQGLIVAHVGMAVPEAAP